MKIENILYKTPEMTEEKLLGIINYRKRMLKESTLNRIQFLHKDIPINEAILAEYDLIQNKSSYLTSSQRQDILGFVGLCLIIMTKGNE